MHQGCYTGTHDDVIKLKHFPRCWPFVRGNHRSPVNSPHKGQWCRTMFSVISAWTNALVSNRYAVDLRRHRAPYDVTVTEESYGSASEMDLSDIGKLDWCQNKVEQSAKDAVIFLDFINWSIVAETQWLPFCRQHFWMNFLEWVLSYLGSNFTDVCF